MNILVSGGAGFIGSHLCEKLLENGHKVRVLDNLHPQIHGTNENSPTLNAIKDRVELIKGDVCDPSIWKKALIDVDVVFHLAAETGTGQSMYELSRYSQTNIQGTNYLLEELATKKYKVKKVILSSTRAVYGEGTHLCKEHGIVFPKSRTLYDLEKQSYECKCPVCHKDTSAQLTAEDVPLSPNSIYGITKLAQEEIFKVTLANLNISFCVFRYQNVYGPRQSLKNPYTGILSIFSTRARKKDVIYIFEDGAESRDFIHVKDVVDATYQGMVKESANNQIFHIGFGKAQSVYEVAKVISTYFNHSKDQIIVNNKFRVGDIRHNQANIQKATSLLEWKPTIDFKVGITDFLKWVDTEEIPEDNYEKSLSELKEKGLYR